MSTPRRFDIPGLVMDNDIEIAMQTALHSLRLAQRSGSCGDCAGEEAAVVLKYREKQRARELARRESVS